MPYLPHRAAWARSLVGSTKSRGAGRFADLGRAAFLAGTLVGHSVLAPCPVSAQSLRDLKTPSEPLVLQQQGSFFVGGRKVRNEHSGWNEVASRFGPPAGDVTVDQLYVQFQKPAKASKVPIVFVHGCCLSAKQWETTPDGRMGWYEYFTRSGYPTYLAEQAGRARSGFNTNGFNEVRLGLRTAGTQPSILMATDQFAWPTFRLGPKLGEPWPDTKFPIDKLDEFYKQVIPDLILTQVPDLIAEVLSPASSLPTVLNLAELADELGGVVLVGHSESSTFPTKAALKGRRGIRGIVQLETGCFGNLTAEQISILAKIPVLVMVGDHFATPQPGPDCIAEHDAISRAGGDMTFISLPDLGIKGNSHMFMQDLNNLEVAQIIMKWLDGHVEAPAKN